MGKPKPNRRVASKREREIGEKKEPKRGGPPRGTGMGRDVAAVVLAAAGVLAGLSLASYSSLDGALIARGLPTASNLVGPAGHHAAALLYRVFGFAALILPVALCFAAVKLFRREPLRLTAVAGAAYGVLVLSAASLAHLFFFDKRLASFPPGGFVGAAIGDHARALFSMVGGVLVALACAVIALIVAADFQVARAVKLAGSASRFLAGLAGRHLADAVQAHREAVRELRAEEDELRRAREAEEAAALAESAEIQANGAADEAEARGVAGELAREQARRSLPPYAADEPAWALELPPPAEAKSGAEAEEEDKPRRKKKAEKCEVKPAEAAAQADAEPVKPEIVLPAPPKKSEKPAEPAVPPVESRPEPLPAVKPEIVLSQAMQERGKKKKEKEQPNFAFTQSGEVFKLPSSELLRMPEEQKQDVDTKSLTRTAEVIISTLNQHGVEGVIRHIRPGPVVTLFEFSPVAGVKLSKIESLDKELTMALSATRIRIIAPIPGKGVVGIEVPNASRAMVYLRDVLESETFARAGGLMPLALGKDIEGQPWCVDLQKMPHLLIAGTTGSGKSVGLNTMILSMLYRQTPDQVRMIMVDPKMTELSIYEDIPHLLLPVVTDPAKAARALQWAVDEMERRTQLLADVGVRDLKSYNSKVDKARAEGRTLGDEDAAKPKKLLVVDVTAGETEEEAAARIAREEAEREATGTVPTPPFEDPTALPPTAEERMEEAEAEVKKAPQKLPYIVVVIDELADLMMTAPREVEISLARLAQKARATGIHLMVATQRPSADVVTGTIKNNFPARISFRVGSRHDSTTIINGAGAEALLGDGDMLVMTATQPITRVQGAFVSEEEVHRVVAFLKEQGKPVFDETILKARDQGEGARGRDDEEDPVYDEALDLVSRMEEVSVSKLQRELRLGYNKAAKIIERMEREGVVGPANGVKGRQVLIRAAGEANPYPNV